MKPNRRKRGGQKGNQNARKHGFYSPTLSPAQTDQLRNSIRVEGVDPRVALVRVKLLSSLQHNPTNRRVLTEASRLLARAYSDMYSLDAADHRDLRDIIDLVMECIFAAHSGMSTGSTTQPTGHDETNQSYFAAEFTPPHPAKRMPRASTAEQASGPHPTHEKPDIESPENRALYETNHPCIAAMVSRIPRSRLYAGSKPNALARDMSARLCITSPALDSWCSG